VTAAFLDEGLTIGASQATFVVSVPVTVAPSVFATYRASVVAYAAGSWVVLSGTIRNDQAAMGGMRRQPGDEPLHSAMTGVLGEAWQCLERIADQLRENARGP
jgi:hypothetical protein